MLIFFLLFLKKKRIIYIYRKVCYREIFSSYLTYENITQWQEGIYKVPYHEICFSLLLRTLRH